MSFGSTHIPRPSREITSQKALEAVDPTRRSAVEERAAQVLPKYRNGYLRAAAGKVPPRFAIKAFCAECCGWVSDEVAACTSPACPLFEYRPWKR